MDITTIIIFIIILSIVVIFIYNKLIATKRNTEEAWSDIDVQLKRRHDLIPQLIETVKGYAKHEKILFEKIARERSNAIKTSKEDVTKLAETEDSLTEDLRSLFMVSEAYPELKANENFLKLQNDLSEIEDQIASSRRIYNSNAADYNTLIALFPNNIIAKLFRFEAIQFFKGDKEDKTVPTV